MLLLVIYSIVTVILTKELVIATDQCTEYQFKTPFFPGVSCEDIYSKNPESHDRPGYYWILDGPSRVYCGMNYTGSSCEDIYNNNTEIRNKSGYYRINDNQWTYCNMTAIFIATGYISTCAGVGGGWRRVVGFDVSAGDNCPIGWTKASNSGYSFCQKSFDGRGCSSTTFSTNGSAYQRVCGKARGYQKGHAAYPWGSFLFGATINATYVDGLSLTYGSPRQHIWTYATGEYDNTGTNCPCDSNAESKALSFVGNHYYCESGRGSADDHAAYHFNDALWDGLNCIHSDCCSVPKQPWFYRQLNQTTSANIEARLCNSRIFVDGFTMIDQLELYIQ